MTEAVLTPSMFRSRARRPARRGRQLKPPRMARHETRLAARILHIAKSVQDNILEELVPELETIVAEQAADSAVVKPLRFDDASGRIARTFGQIKVFAEQLLPEARLKNAAERSANEVNAANKEFNSENVRTVLGVDVFVTEPWLAPEIEAFTRENVSLIRGVSDEEIADIEQLVFRMVRAGDGPQPIRAAIQLAMAATKSRAKLIARDQIGKFNGRLSQLRQAQLGVVEYTWRTSDDERVRPSHQQLDDTVQKWNEAPVTVFTGKRSGEQNHPGQDIQCVPGDSKVLQLQGARKFFRRDYAGKLTTLVTDDGDSARATPHHPILTGRGWLAFDSVEVGDKIFKASSQRGLVRENDVQQPDSRIAGVFDALAKVFVPGVTVRGVRGQFHGDGTDQEVSIIDTDGCLADVLDATVSQDLCEKILTWADARIPDALLDKSRALEFALQTLWCPTDGIVSGACKLLALFGSNFAHAQEHRIAAAAWLDPLLQQPSANNVPADSIFFRDGFFAHSCEILSADRAIIEVLAMLRRVAFPRYSVNAPSAEELAQAVRVASDDASGVFERAAIANKPLRVVDQFAGDHEGPVFNVETTAGWFIAERTVIHNCRCIAEPIFPDEKNS